MVLGRDLKTSTHSSGVGSIVLGSDVKTSAQSLGMGSKEKVKGIVTMKMEAGGNFHFGEG